MLPRGPQSETEALKRAIERAQEVQRRAQQTAEEVRQQRELERLRREQGPRPGRS